MGTNKLMVNGVSVVDSEQVSTIRDKLQGIRLELFDGISQEQITAQTEVLREKGRQVLREAGLPEFFLVKVECFPGYIEDPDEVLLVGLELLRLVPDHKCFGFAVYGRNVRSDSVTGEVTMKVLCRSSSALFEYVIPVDSKVVELIVEPSCVSVLVTCPAVIDSFVLRTAFYTDCIDSSVRLL